LSFFGLFFLVFFLNGIKKNSLLFSQDFLNYSALQDFVKARGSTTFIRFKLPTMKKIFFEHSKKNPVLGSPKPVLGTKVKHGRTLFGYFLG